jgi:hypothetical protein
MTDREKALEAALREAERFMAYFSGETDGVFVGMGMPTECLAKMRAAIAMPATVGRPSWEAGRDAAVKWHEEKIAILEEQIAENNAYAKRSGGAVAGANIYCRELQSGHRLARDAIRNLTPLEDAP